MDSGRREVRVSRVGQQLPDGLLRSVVIAFAEMMIANLSGRIDEIVGGPILIFETLPDRIVIIEGDRVGDFRSLTAWRTLPKFFSNANSGAWTPITTSP